MAEQAYYQTPSHVIAAAVVLPVLDIIAVGLRFYTRRRQHLSLATDDWLTIPALILVIGTGANIIAGVALRAIAYPTPPLMKRSDLSLSNYAITVSSQVEWAFYLLTIPALGLIKLSFLFFYRRIFCTGKTRSISWVLNVSIAIMVGWTISFFFAHLFSCGTRFTSFWGSTLELETCVKTLDLLLSLVTTDVVTDLMILVIPIPLIWRLHMDLGRKLAVMAVFLLGSVAFAASLTRFVEVVHVVQVGFDPHADEDLTITATLYWGMIEVGLGLFAACLPTLRFLFKGFSPESLAASIRSVFSLNSMDRSRGSQENHSRSNDRRIRHESDAAPDNTSDASQAHINAASVSAA